MSTLFILLGFIALVVSVTVVVRPALVRRLVPSSWGRVKILVFGIIFTLVLFFIGAAAAPATSTPSPATLPLIVPENSTPVEQSAVTADDNFILEAVTPNSETNDGPVAPIAQPATDPVSTYQQPASPESASQSDPLPYVPVYVPSPVYDEPVQTSCCKYCSKGKACGDSCISRSYTCHQPPGCACDSE